MTQAISRTPYAADRLDDLAAFCHEHATTGHPPDLVRRLIGRLPSDEAAVFDVRLDGERCLVAVVLDTLANKDNAAVFDVLGWTGAGSTDDLWPWVLDQAEARVLAGSRRTVSFALSGRTAHLGPWLTARHYDHRFSLYGMATGPIEPPAALPVPPGWHWQPLDASSVRAYYEAVVASMGQVPGTNIAAYDDFAPMALQAPILPQLLYDGEQVAGFFRVSLAGDALDEGYVSAIGRTPPYKGNALGPILLTAAMALLAGHGARRYALDVAATNVRALSLYERHGFRSVSEEPHYLRDLGP